MKKSEAIEKLKAKTHAIYMNRRSDEDVKLLNDLFGVSGFDGFGNFYFYSAKFGCFTYDKTQPNLFIIPISTIETDVLFKAGEEVEADNWTSKIYYIGENKRGESICESKTGVLYKFAEIRKVNHKRKQAIEKIKELMSKFEIKNDEV